MGRSWQIAVIRGIPIKIHWSFFIIPLFYGLGAGSLAGAVRGVVFILLVFACVVLHELGHSIAAQYYGITVREIILLPLGGVAQLQSLPKKPMRELVIALAGPAVNVIIVIALAAVVPGLLNMRALTQQATASAGMDLLRDLAITNLFLALFNLIPAFPMDGGRVLRALLGLVLPYKDATRIAAWVGRVFAVGFVLIGLFTGNFLLALVGVFIFSGAGAEYGMVRRQAALDKLSAADVTRPAVSLHPLDLLGQVLPGVLSSAQPLYPVMDGQRLEGMITPQSLQLAMQRFGPATPLEQVAAVPTGIPADMSLFDLYELMRQRNANAVLVMEGARPLGVAHIADVVQALKNL